MVAHRVEDAPVVYLALGTRELVRRSSTWLLGSAGPRIAP